MLASRMPLSRAAHPEVHASSARFTPTAVESRSSGGATLAQRTPKWLTPFFRFADACPRAARLLRPVACRITPVVAPAVREAIRLNAVRIFGRQLAPAEQRRFAHSVVGSFYDFVLDMGRASRMSVAELAELVEAVQGLEGYRASRASRRGAVLVTAHLGTFEAGLAALARVEKRVRVVFKRDSVAAFEAIRSRLHGSLGVIETPIDDGIGSWLALREALLRDEVVVMQADRAVPGQKSEVVPFLHGHLRIPTGPMRLAQLTGSPIIPVFALRTPAGRQRLVLGPAIEPDSGIASEFDRRPLPSAALRAVADSIAAVVAENPHQWLALEPVFHEDRADASR